MMTLPEPDLGATGIARRRAVAALSLPAVALLSTPWLAGLAAARAAPLRPTPAQTEGPFYPVSLPADSDADLLRQGELAYGRGQACWLAGSVSDLQGRPLAGAWVEIWQCDADGRYHHPGDGSRADPAFQGFGRVAVDAAGRYRFRTMRPVAYGGRAPHIHVKLRHGRRTLLTTQVYVADDPGNGRDFLWRSLQDPADRAALTPVFRRAADGLQAEFNIVVAL